MGCFNLRNPKTIGQAINPRRLYVHGRTEGFLALVRKDNQLRSSVMRIRLEGDESLRSQIIHDPLHILAIPAHVTRQPRDRLRALRGYDSAQHLPACARQTQVRNQPIACVEHAIVEPEELKDDVRQGPPPRGVLGFAHVIYAVILTPRCQHGNLTIYGTHLSPCNQSRRSYFMLSLRPMDPAFPIEKQLQATATPAILVNLFTVAEIDISALMAACS
jgi:hypothetical protein